MAIENLQPVTYAINSILFAIGTASIFLCLYCRACLLKVFGVDNAVTVLLVFVNSTQQSVLYIFLHYRCGLHIGVLNEYQLFNIKMLFIMEVVYMCTHWTIKQVFLSFYLHLSPNLVF
ncbi:hypothetical protein M432DRAFT_7 [Thermoascus aurantiacus ATCC 26904]